MARLTKDQIIQTASPVEFESEELGGSVLIAPLSAGAYVAMQDDFAKAEKDPDYKGEFMCRLVAASLVDEDGDRLFTSSELGALKNARGIVILELFNKVMEVNGLTENPEGN